MMYLEVAVAAPLLSTLTYLLPDYYLGSNRDDVDFAGRKVLVPLGRRQAIGYVLGRIKNHDGGFVIKEIRDILGDEPLFPANMVPFFRWISHYYQYPIGEVITTALPAGLKGSSGRVIQLKDPAAGFAGVNGDLDQQKFSWLTELEEKGRIRGIRARKILANATSRRLVGNLREQGLIDVIDEVDNQEIGDKSEVCYRSGDVIDINRAIDDPASCSFEHFAEDIRARGGHELKLSEIKTLYHYSRCTRDNAGEVPRKEILKVYRGAAKALKELCRLGILKKEKKRIYRNPFGERPPQLPAPKELSQEQIEALRQIRKCLDASLYKVFLLHGITGSGKTEVYLQAAQVALDSNKDILVLVPEIALATQLEAHFLSRFGDRIALLHSGLSGGEKYDQWSLAATGKAKIVIGARSAVFAPLANIGLIIVDEEHDSGFKQDDSLKYNGRDLAVVRGKLHNCSVILGSATPSVTSYHNARQQKYQLLNLTHRVGSGSLPHVTLIDLSKEAKQKRKSVLNRQFVEALQRSLDREEQSLLLINRRGFSASYICQECGTAVGCAHCNVTLTYHKKNNSLICHYCGYSVSSQLICANCRSSQLVPMGVGTQRVEEELRELFPDAAIERLDADTASDRKKFLSLLNDMRQRRIDILIGTQMIAKGHHFPHVSFVGVVWADGGLNMPDFRAAERTFQLLSQVTGRAGRGASEGRVIIQTMRPHHYAIDLARSHEYEQFYQKELAIRQRPAFPPFVRLACYRVSGEIEYEVRKTAENLAAGARSYAAEKQIVLEVLGPAPSPLEKIKDKYRWQILLKSPHSATFQVLGAYISDRRSSVAVGKVHIALDLDPDNMM